MKGALHTDELMDAVVDAALVSGPNAAISHIYVLDVPTYREDAADHRRCDQHLSGPRRQARHRPERYRPRSFARHREAEGCDPFGGRNRQSPRITSTLDAAALCKMADRGQITGGLIDGPLAFDNAISRRRLRRRELSRRGGRRRHPRRARSRGGNMMAKQHDLPRRGGRRRHCAWRARADHAYKSRGQPDRQARLLCIGAASYQSLRKSRAVTDVLLVAQCGVVEHQIRRLSVYGGVKDQSQF